MYLYFSGNCVNGEELSLWLYSISLVALCGVLIWNSQYKVGDELIMFSLMQMSKLWASLLALSRLKITLNIWIVNLLCVLILPLWALEFWCFSNYKTSHDFPRFSGFNMSKLLMIKVSIFTFSNSKYFDLKES